MGLKHQDSPSELSKEIQKHEYMMLARLKNDVQYFFGYGNRSEAPLYYSTIEKHINEMLRLWDTLKIKPQWITRQTIEEYKNKI